MVDEALAVGDEKFQRKCFTRIEELKRKGTSILFVSHSGAQIIELCDKALLLEHGVRLLYTQPLKAVRAYQKLIYASEGEQKHLVNEYSMADQSGQDISILDPAESKSDSDVIQTDMFDPGLAPQTKEIYTVQGAEIQSFRILNEDGQTVNVLQPGENYLFEVSGRFVSDSDKVYFGIHIRSISGMAITGQRYPEQGSFIDHVRAGESFRITYGFRMILLPG